MVPPHFYGVMAKTDLGCHVLQEKGHFPDFAQFIRQHGLESDDPDIIMKLKSILWAVVSCNRLVDLVRDLVHDSTPSQGNIGAAERGLPFLEVEEIIPAILEIAEKSLVLSVRGSVEYSKVLGHGMTDITQNMFLRTGPHLFYPARRGDIGRLSVGSHALASGCTDRSLCPSGHREFHFGSYR